MLGAIAGTSGRGQCRSNCRDARVPREAGRCTGMYKCCERHDYKDVGGRISSGTEIEDVESDRRERSGYALARVY
jgi:hypothetical protein